MFHGDSIAVLLWQQFGCNPLAGIYAQPGSGLVLTIEQVAGVLRIVALHPVITRVVGYLDELVGQNLGLRFSRPRVLLSKRFIGVEPAHHCRHAGHVEVNANRPQRLTHRQTLANLCDYFVSLY